MPCRSVTDGACIFYSRALFQTRPCTSFFLNNTKLGHRQHKKCRFSAQNRSEISRISSNREGITRALPVSEAPGVYSTMQHLARGLSCRTHGNCHIYAELLVLYGHLLPEPLLTQCPTQTGLILLFSMFDNAAMRVSKSQPNVHSLNRSLDTSRYVNSLSHTK